MAFPTTVVSTAGLGGFSPPHISDSGNVYVVAQTTTTTIDVYKATDPESSFAIQDGSNNPSTSNTYGILSTRLRGGIIHIATWDNAGDTYEYHSFDTSDDTWSVTDETIEAISTDTPALGWISIDARSDGDVVVVYNGETENVSAAEWERSVHNVREGGTWAGPVIIHNGGATQHVGNGTVTKGIETDDMHIFMQTVSGAPNPPTAWSNVVCITLDPANSLSSADTDVSDTDSTLLGVTNNTAYIFDGTNYAATLGSDGSFRTWSILVEDGSNDVTFESQKLILSDAPINGEFGINSIVAHNGILYNLHAHASTFDLLLSTSSDNAVNINTAVEILDAVTINFVYGNIYERGGNQVLAYTYDDGGVYKYNEEIIGLLPTTIFSAVGMAGHHGPWKSSTGNFYAIARDGLVLKAMKATDPTGAWVEQDVAGRPSNLSSWADPGDNVSAVQDGDLIHMASSPGNYEYHTFNMADDTWGITNEVIETGINANIHWISIAIRSDGDVIVAYNGIFDAPMHGEAKERVDYARREATVWTVGVALDAGGDNHFGNPNVVKGPLTDDMHFMWQITSNTADPPTAWEGVRARTLDPSNNLSTTDNNALDTSGALLGLSNGIAYDDGTQRMLFNGVEGVSGNARLYWPMTEDGSDDVQFTSPSVLDSAGADVFINGEVGILSIAELTGDIHQLYSGGGTDGADKDLYYTKSTDDGATWDTPTEEIDAITVDFISANIYAKGAITDTGFKFPGTMVGNRTVAGSDDDWVNPDNCKADDGSSASVTITSSDQSSGLAASNFDFSSIPSDSIILGIEVRVGDYLISTNEVFNWANLRLIMPDNSDGTEDKSTDILNPDTTLNTDEAGGATVLWSELFFTVADVKDVDFGFFVSIDSLDPQTATVDVDFLQMKIYYAPPPIVIAYVYDDGGAQKYNEKVLIAVAPPPPVGPPMPPFWQRKYRYNPSLRM